MTIPQPYFSVITPVYNRARLIGRALSSCLCQDFRDFEVIVVDDGSTDGTWETARKYADSNVRLVRHEHNRGVCPARNTGVSAARGQWLIFLDSDDELLPGALSFVYNRTLEVAPDIVRLVFMYRLDDGGTSPDPPLAHEIWDYIRYIKWVATPKDRGDYCNVIRKCAFEKVHFPDSRAKETFFHMDLARLFLTRSCPDVVGLIHSDADKRSLHFSTEGLTRDAPDAAAAMEQLLSRHGEAVRQMSPQLYWQCIRGASTTHFLAGNRTQGVCYAVGYLLRNPLSARIWAVTAFGLLGSKPLAWLKARGAPALVSAFSAILARIPALALLFPALWLTGSALKS